MRFSTKKKISIVFSVPNVADTYVDTWHLSLLRVIENTQSIPGVLPSVVSSSIVSSR